MRWGKAKQQQHMHIDEQDESLEAGSCIRCNGVQYTLCDVLGNGAHCTVWRCLRVSSGGPR